MENTKNSTASMGPKIVIIEDEPMLLKALNIELLGEKFQIASAQNGVSGLELVEKEKPDLVLLDLLLPRISGFDVLQKMKENPETKNIPVIILSNLSEEDQVKKALKLGAEDFFIKSNIKLEQIVKKVKTVLKMK